MLNGAAAADLCRLCGCLTGDCCLRVLLLLSLLQEYCDCGTLSSWVGNTLVDPADNEQVLQLLLLLQVRQCSCIAWGTASSCCRLIIIHDQQRTP